MSTVIYLDNAATTRVAPEVAEVVASCMLQDYGNPSSAHSVGIAAQRRVKRARAQVAAALGDDEGALGQVVFTSGGTEADALGVLGAARARAGRGKRVLYGASEHPAVIESCALLEREGWQIDSIPVGPDGRMDPAMAAARVDDETTVVAVMLVNNELGSVTAVAEVAAAVRARRPGVHVHCDAVQALGKLAIDVSALNADSVAVSAHKLHGPKGAGALWVRKGARVAPLWAGGGQQGGVRSGTENVPGIAGLGAAAELAVAALDEHRARWTELGAALVDGAQAAGVNVRRTIGDAPAAPNIVSLAFPGLPAEPLLHALEGRGVMVSAGSACASAHKGPSHVLAAIGVPDDTGVLRVSFGRDTTRADIDAAVAALAEAARAL